MYRSSHRLATLPMLAIGFLACTSIVSARADHQIYPPGWNVPATATAPVLYQFVPGGSRLHVMPAGTTAPASAATPVGERTAASPSRRSP